MRVPCVSHWYLSTCAFPLFLCTLPRRFSTASCLPPSPPTEKKEAENEVKRPKNGKVVKWMERGAGRIRVEPWSGQDGVRVERGWSKDRARAARAQWRVRRLHKLGTKNDAYLFTLFAFPTVWNSLPLTFFSSPRLLSLLSLSFLFQEEC